MYIKLPITKRFRLLRKIFKPKIYPEAFFAYLHRLPDTIEVQWFRDEGMIVGKVKSGDIEFMTQGQNAKDFIHMVNDSLLAVCNIPDDYFDIISKTRSYTPRAEEKSLLDDRSVTHHSFGLQKVDRVLKLA